MYIVNNFTLDLSLTHHRTAAYAAAYMYSSIHVAAYMYRKQKKISTVEPHLHNNAFKGTPPLEDKISKSKNYSGFYSVKIPLVNSLCFNSDSPF